MPAKADAPAIRAVIASLPIEVTTAPDGWLRFAFHSTRIENAARILEAGRLVARGRGESFLDAARPDLIAGLARADLQWVRLYFRPRTPTNYANEGVRPRSKIEHDAHMPVPVYLLFGLADLLAEKGVSFTNGRMASGTPRGESAASLRSLPFKLIYHDSGVGQLGAAGRSETLNARHSEILVRDELPLTHMQWIVCRSPAERATLLNLLEPGVRARWEAKIVLEASRRLFYKRGTFVESAELSSSSSSFTFSVQTLGRDWRGPFDLEVVWEGSEGWRHQRSLSGFTVEPTPTMFSLPTAREEYSVRLALNGDLVFSGRFQASVGPQVFG